MEKLKRYIDSIEPIDKAYSERMEKYIDHLTKPVGALGKLEEIVCRLAAIKREEKLDLDPKCIVIMCSDNGVYQKGISECPQEVTATVTYNFTRGITGVNRLAEYTHSKIHVVDIGVKADFNHPQIISRKVKYGTEDFSQTKAMTLEEAVRAIWVGIEETEKLIAQGIQVLGTGEMGIGNTTTAAAVIAALTHSKVDDVVGKGAGALEGTFNRKKQVIHQALDLHKSELDHPLGVLSCVGGLDIAGLVGVYLAAAKNQKPVIIDGFISVAAALIAYALQPLSRAYMFASHLSEEKGMQKALEVLELTPHFDLGMRLGEGSGCPIMFQLIDMAYFTLSTMGTFDEANVDERAYMNIWK